MNRGCYRVSSRARAWKSTKPYFHAKWRPKDLGINETGRSFLNSPWESLDLRIGRIAFESLFLVGLTCPPYTRGGRPSKTQKTQCTRCTKKTKKTQRTRCTNGGRWKIEDGRWEAGLGG